MRLFKVFQSDDEANDFITEIGSRYCFKEYISDNSMFYYCQGVDVGKYIISVIYRASEDD